MRNGFKVFDADAHVIEPKDLWQRFLDKKYQHRVSWKQPFEGMDRFRPATVDGRYTQSHKTLYGRQQEAVRWTTEAMRKAISARSSISSSTAPVPPQRCSAKG